jgi:predicted dehydrogenase
MHQEYISAMDPSAPRVLVLGAGRMGMHHIRAILRTSHLALVGVLDSDSDRCSAVAPDVPCPVDSDLARLVRATSPEAAIVATWDHTHLDLSLRALDLGLHVLVEKPLAPDLQSAHRLIQHAEHRGKVLQDGLVERHNPAWHVFLEQAHRIGTPQRLEIVRLGRRASNTDSGILLDLAIHDLDLLHQWLGGLPPGLRRIQPSKGRSAILTSQHPFPVRLEVSWDSPESRRRWLLEGDAGILAIDLGNRTATFTPPSGAPESLAVAPTDALEAEHAQFACSIRLGPPIPDALRRHLAILERLLGA